MENTYRDIIYQFYDKKIDKRIKTYCDSINIRFVTRKCLLAHSISNIPELKGKKKSFLK